MIKNRWGWCIFDLDGTLIDSSIAIGEGVRHALKSLGINGITNQDIKRWIGRPLYEIWEGYAKEYKLNIILNEQKLDELASLYLEGHHNHFPQGILLYPTVRETLDSLRDRGIGVAVATTKWESSARHVIEGLKLETHLDSICGTDPGKPVKPDPFVVNLAMERLGADPGRTLMIGDTVADILAAKAAGCGSVAVTYGFGEKEDLIAVEPDFIVDDLPSLLDLVLRK